MDKKRRVLYIFPGKEKSNCSVAKIYGLKGLSGTNSADYSHRENERSKGFKKEKIGIANCHTDSDRPGYKSFILLLHLHALHRRSIVVFLEQFSIHLPKPEREIQFDHLRIGQSVISLAETIS